MVVSPRAGVDSLIAETLVIDMDEIERKSVYEYTLFFIDYEKEDQVSGVYSVSLLSS